MPARYKSICPDNATVTMGQCAPCQTVAQGSCHPFRNSISLERDHKEGPPFKEGPVGEGTVEEKHPHVCARALRKHPRGHLKLIHFKMSLMATLSTGASPLSIPDNRCSELSFWGGWIWNFGS
ncbi:hypothetical protein AVEN_199865-1 [Araneus ventricosus]|uniref:Uncharacterized protein n=1 Tax=Araneus ventricosus TaxID=182803 RepID=A0A4Y2THH6_ARAVE|nr:hypothetical protein AVEN_199865-1 [Araneus ventricosus]